MVSEELSVLHGGEYVAEVLQMTAGQEGERAKLVKAVCNGHIHVPSGYLCHTLLNSVAFRVTPQAGDQVFKMRVCGEEF